MTSYTADVMGMESSWPTTVPDTTKEIRHETDDILDILHIGQLSGLGGVSGLSASAKEFTPRGGSQAFVPTATVGDSRQHDRLSWGDGSVSGQELLSSQTSEFHQERATVSRAERENFMVHPADYHRVDDQQLGEPAWVEEMFAEVQLQAELLEVLAESFSDCSPDCLQVALAKSGWDLDRASATVHAALQAAVDAAGLAKPCRHMISGECLRKDCVFSHDFARTTCCYWLQRQCFNGDGCLFMHDLDVATDTEVSEQHLGRENMEPKGIENVEEIMPAGSSAPPALQIGNFPSLTSKRTNTMKWSSSSSSSASLPSSASNTPTKSVASLPCFSGAISSSSLSSFQLKDEDLERSRVGIQGLTAEGSSSVASEASSECGAKEGGDLLLATAISVAKKGGVGKRKGGRGRKTRYSTVSLQALMRAEPVSSEGGSGLAACQRASSHRPPPETSGAANRREHGLSFADIVGSNAQGRSDESGSRVPGVAGPSPAARSKQKGGDKVPRAGRHGSEGGSVGVFPWVSTGEAVAAQYEVARKEAAELARARNKLFMAATEAFRRGQGMMARDLARRGRELNKQMKEKHRKAARDIFDYRNPGDQVFLQRRMDLHGLHVVEAVTVLDEELAALSTRGVVGVRVLAGSGHHSKGPTSKARLIPAVENYCQSRGISYQRVADQGTGHVGIIDVSLNRPTSGYDGLITSPEGHNGVGGFDGWMGRGSSATDGVSNQTFRQPVVIR